MTGPSSESGNCFRALLGNLPVRVRIGGPAPAAARHLLRGLPRTGKSPEAELVIGGRAPRVPPGAPDEATGSLRLWHGERSLLVDSGFGLRASVVPGRAVVGGRVVGARYEEVLRFALQPVTTHLLGFAGRFALHAAAVARDGQAIVLLGDTGQGKSTVAYAAHRAGWQVLTDDLVVVGAGLQVIGVHRPVHVPPDVAGPGPRLAGDARGRIAAELPLDTGRHAAAAVVVVAHSRGPDGAVHRLPAVVVAQRAFTGLPVGRPDFARSALDLAGELARLPGYALELPAPPSRRLDFVAETLPKLLAR